MSGADNIVFNTREKATSADQNDAQALEARTLATVLRFWTMSRVSGIGGTDTEMINQVVNGLQVVASGSTVLIRPGFLLQESATVTPTPGALDSPYRVALNHADMNPSTATPAPTGNTYYLLEAKMQELDTLTESRNILNATSGNFVATNVVKRRERRLITQWIGTDGSATYPTPTGGDWVVLAGVFRQAGGGAIAAGAIQDMRLQPDVLVGEALLDRSERAHVNRVSVNADGDVLTKISAYANVPIEAPYNRALRLSLSMYQGSAPAGFDASSALVKDTTTTFAADTWYYVYLATWFGLAPRTNTAGISSRGVLVVSHVQPSAFSAGNGAVLNLPAPFSAYVVPAGGAKCIAIIRRNTANTGFRAVEGAGSVYRFSGQVATAPSVVTGTFPQNALLIAAADLPRARTITFAYHGAPNITTGFSTDAYLSLKARAGGAGVTLAQVRVPAPTATVGTRLDIEMEVPYNSAGIEFLLEVLGTAGSLTASSGSANVYIVGWTY